MRSSTAANQASETLARSWRRRLRAPPRLAASAPLRTTRYNHGSTCSGAGDCCASRTKASCTRSSSPASHCRTYRRSAGACSRYRRPNSSEAIPCMPGLSGCCLLSRCRARASSSRLAPAISAPTGPSPLLDQGPPRGPRRPLRRRGRGLRRPLRPRPRDPPHPPRRGRPVVRRGLLPMTREAYPELMDRAVW